MKIRKPTFYDEFICIGGDCPLTCCGGWYITVDKKGYKSYRKMGGIISKFAKKYILYDKEENIYYVKSDPVTKLCPMCNEEQLYNIIKEKGEDALSGLCKEFPRIVFQTCVGEEKYLSCACPQVVEMLYNLDHKILFVSELGTSASMNDIQMIPIWYSVNLQIREVMIDFIHKDELPLWFRQFYGMYILTKVKDDYIKEDYDSVCSEIAYYCFKDYREAVYEAWNKIEVNREQQFQSMYSLVCLAAEQIKKLFI